MESSRWFKIFKQLIILTDAGALVVMFLFVGVIIAEVGYLDGQNLTASAIPYSIVLALALTKFESVQRFLIRLNGGLRLPREESNQTRLDGKGVAFVLFALVILLLSAVIFALYLILRPI